MHNPAMANYIVGLTGGVASGKSEVTRRFEALGVTVADADIAARDAVALGSEGLAAVVAAFGPGALAADGSLDRPAMRRRVFADGAARLALEAIARLNIDLCVLGACAVSAKGGVSAYDPADASFKRALTAHSRSTIVLATNDKLGQHAPHRVLGVDALTQIVVEHDADADLVRDLTKAGATIARADPQDPRGQR